jgi:hypothetical protein
MGELSIEQIRGLKNLIHEGVISTVNTTEDTHRALARQPYAVLQRIPGIAQPARTIEQIQSGITSGVYWAIRGIAAATALLATTVIDHMEQR